MGACMAIKRTSLEAKSLARSILSLYGVFSSYILGIYIAILVFSTVFQPPARDLSTRIHFLESTQRAYSLHKYLPKAESEMHSIIPWKPLCS
jgi:hypothetical protein